MDAMRKISADLLAAVAGYQIKTVIPPTGIVLNVFNGLTEPEVKDGIWFKTDDILANTVLKMWEPVNVAAWETIASTPTSPSSSDWASVGTKMHVFKKGGALHMVYDSDINSWSTKTAPPFTSQGGHGVWGNNIFLFSDSGVLWEYDTLTETWSNRGAIPYNTYLHMIGNAWCVSGFFMYEHKTTNSNYRAVYRYNIDTHVWSSDAWVWGQPYMYVQNSTAPFDDAVHCIGGYLSSGVNTHRVYDPITTAWSSAPSYYTAVYDLVVGRIDNRIFCAGGDNKKNTCQIYDRSTGVWTSGPNLLTSTSYYSAGGGTVGNKIIIIRSSSTTVEMLATIGDVEYNEGTVLLVIGTSVAISSSNIVTMSSGIRINVADAWVTKDGALKNYETYWGNGISWVKKKDADV